MIYDTLSEAVEDVTNLLRDMGKNVGAIITKSADTYWPVYVLPSPLAWEKLDLQEIIQETEKQKSEVIAVFATIR